jgi:hypothetical protein
VGRGDPRSGEGNGHAPYFAKRGKQRVRARANRSRGILALLALASSIGLGLGVATGVTADPKHGVRGPLRHHNRREHPVGEPEPILHVIERRAPAHDRLDHCTLHQEGVDKLGTFLVDGDVWISYTPTQ